MTLYGVQETSTHLFLGYSRLFLLSSYRLSVKEKKYGIGCTGVSWQFLARSIPSCSDSKQNINFCFSNGLHFLSLPRWLEKEKLFPGRQCVMPFAGFLCCREMGLPLPHAWTGRQTCMHTETPMASLQIWPLGCGARESRGKPSQENAIGLMQNLHSLRLPYPQLILTCKETEFRFCLSKL